MRFTASVFVLACLVLNNGCAKLQSGSASGSLADLLIGISDVSNNNSGNIRLIFDSPPPTSLVISVDHVPVSKTIRENLIILIPNVQTGARTIQISATGYHPYQVEPLTVIVNQTTQSQPIHLSALSTRLSLLQSNQTIYLGIFDPKHSITEINSSLQKKPALWGLFIPMLFRGEIQTIDRHIAAIQTIVQADTVPVITWEPWDPGGNKGQNILPDIVQGKYDPMITQWAISIRDLNYPVIIRWGHEMQGDWYPWGKDAGMYRRAFQHIVEIFRLHGANQALWMFAPNHNDGGSGRHYDDYFPGQNYVDLIGISGYNFGTTQPKWNSTWRSFDEIFGPITDQLSQKYHLPIILDVASAELGGSKSDWIHTMAQQLTTQSRYRLVKGFIWFNEDKRDQDETDWQFSSTLSSFLAFKALCDNALFLDRPVFEPN